MVFVRCVDTNGKLVHVTSGLETNLNNSVAHQIQLITFYDVGQLLSKRLLKLYRVVIYLSRLGFFSQKKQDDSSTNMYPGKIIVKIYPNCGKNESIIC